MAPPKGRTPRAEDDLLDWFTVSYKSIWTAVLIVLAVAGGAGAWWYAKNHPVTLPAVDIPAPTVTTARFTTMEGAVKVKGVGTFEWIAADKSMLLKKGDLVRTGSSSSAEITFFDGTLVHVRPDSLITIEETSEDPNTKARKVAWHITSGEVHFDTAKKNVANSSVEASTPTSRIQTDELSSTDVKVADSGESELKIFRGSGTVTTKQGQRVALDANKEVTVDVSGKAGEIKVLPDAPQILAPAHQAEITYPDPSRATTLLAWKGVATADAYHVMLDYSAFFNRPLVDRKGYKDTTVEVRGLDEGKYYWRVAAVDKNGVEGNFSEFAKFTVARPSGASSGSGPPPPLTIESLDVRTNILQVKGKTEPGASVTVNGQRVDVQNDGTFNEFITLEKPGRQIVVIRSTGINGGLNEQRRPVVVAF